MFSGKKSVPGVTRTGWDVSITVATRQGRTYYYDYADESPPQVVEGVIAVRLTLDGAPKLTYGTLKITDNDFEDKLATMRAECMEKSAALNAVGAL